ncbi:MAG: CopD family protein [Porticoccaceae bacterium]
MLWILAVHVSAMLSWCAALLYLPVLIVGINARRAGIMEMRRPFNTVERFVFTHVATPAALVAIMSGTAVFVLNRTVDGWLVAKLTLVTGLVICHTLVGLLVLRAESVGDGQGNDKSLRPWCQLLGSAVCVLIAAILWVVLAKPSLALS